MGHNIHELLRNDPQRWDRLITDELSREISRIAGEKVGEIPEIRRFLAVKGFRDLRDFLKHRIENKPGQEGLRAAITGMRIFAHERPGISAAAFRSAFTDCPEWRQAGLELATLFMDLMSEIGLNETQAIDALCTIRALVRGFVMHEMQGSFLETDCERAFEFAVDALLTGLQSIAVRPIT